jgi:stearoyl-CoA desaturase (delta-9 desaturase)
VTVILVFLFVHWQASVFFQSFFLHRYGAHRQFTMSKGWERFFHFSAWAVCGSSFLNPRAYAIMHRMHHAYSDTEQDPHSPVHQPNLFKMMWRTKDQYADIKNRRVAIPARFDGGYPEWKLLDETLAGWPMTIAWGAAYSVFYLVVAPHWWFVFLSPINWFMGPVHGAIVNYLGHFLGYRNFDSDDRSRNTLVVDVLTMGELFQNNHHKFGQSPNFAVRWFELDPTYQVIRVLGWVGILDMSKAQIARWNDRKPAAPSPSPSLPMLPEPSPMDGE